MAGLKENTTYGPKSFTNLANFNPQKQIIASTPSSSPRSSAAVKPARMTPFAEETVTTNTMPIEPYDVIGGQPVNGNLPPTPMAAVAAPTDYASWRNPSAVPIGTKFANLSAQLGGGQFAVTPAGASDYDVRSKEIGNDVTRASYIPGIAGINGGAMQVDHIIPVFLGGTDTDDNKQILSIKDHLKKTKTQEVVRALYQNKIIGKKEALNYAINWQNLPGADEVDLTPVDQASKQNKILAEQGQATKPIPTINVDAAKRIFNEWKNPSTDLGFWGSLKGIKDNWGDAVKKVQTAVNNTAVKFVPPATWDFVKGITEGYTGGWIKAGETPEVINGIPQSGFEKGLGKVSKFAGNMVGSIAAWVTLERVLQKGLQKVGTKMLGTKVGSAATATEKYLFSPAVKTAVAKTGAKTAETVASATKATTAAEKALMEAAANTTKIATAQQGTLAANQIAKDGLAKMVASRDLGKLITRNVVVSNIFGQLSRPIEGEERSHRLISDTVNGLIFGATPPGLKNAYIPAVLGAASTYIASGDPTAALQTGLMFGGMHALGAVSGPAAETSIVRDAVKIARENAEDHIFSITGRKLPTLPKAGSSEATINKYKIMIDNEVQNAIDMATDAGKITPTNAANEVKRLKVVAQVLKGEADMQYMDWRKFAKNAEKDWAAFNIKETGPTGELSVRERQNLSPEAVAFFNSNPDLVLRDAEPAKIPPRGTTEAKQLGLDDMNAQNFNHVQLTGVTNKADPMREANIKEFIRLVKEGEMKPEVYISRDRSLVPYIEAVNKKINPADVKAGKAQIYDPEKVLVAFYKHPETNEFKIVGVVPTEKRIGEIVTSPNGTRTVKGMPDSQNENVVRFNRPSSLDHTMNNETWTNEMIKHKINTMKVGVDDFYEGRIGTNIGDISEKPYLHVTTSDSLWREAKYRNRNVANIEAKTTQDAIRSWQEQMKRGEKPVEMKSPEEINKEFDKLVKNKKLNIPKDVASELTTADKTQLMRDYYARTTPKVAEAIVTAHTGKPTVEAKTASEGSKVSLLNEDLPTPPTTASKGQKVVKNDPPQATPPDFLNPDAPQPAPKAKSDVKLSVDSKPSTVNPPETAPKPTADSQLPTADVGKGEKAGKKPSPKAWSTYDSETKINKGINEIVNTQYKELYKTDKKAALELRKKAKTLFTRDGDRTRAQNAFEKAGKSEFDGFGQFYKDTLADLKTLTGKDVNLSPEEVSVLHRQYNRLLQGHTRRAILLDTKNSKVKIAASDADLLGEADRSIMEFNKKHKLPADSMEIVGIDENSEFRQDWGGKMEPAERIYRINQDLRSVPEEGGKTSEFIPIGKAAKGEKSVLAVKYQPELVKMYDQAKHGGTNLNDRSKFLRVFAQDVLGLPKDITADDFVKRSPLIFQRYERYMGKNPNEKATIHILKSKSVKDAGGVDSTQFKNPEGALDKEAMRIYGDAKEFDGKLVLGEDLFDHLVESFHFGGKNKQALKPILQGMVEVEGATPGQMQYMIQKGHIIKADPAYRAHIKEQYGLDFGRNEGVSFAENVKIGPEEGKVKVPLKNFFMKNLQYENESGIGPSFYSKFTDKDNVTRDIVKIDKKNLQNLNELTEQLIGAKSREEMDSAFKAFEEKTGMDVSNFTYGTKEKIYENGAGRKRFAQDLKKLVKNLFFDTVYKPKVEDSKMLFLTPSIKLKLDGPNQPARYLKSDEVAIGKKYAQIAKIKDGDQVIVKREPANHISDYVYAKARVGDEMGATSLGDEHIMLSSHNTYVKVKGDHDGDPVAIFKVGEANMPKSFADAIEDRGKHVIPIKEATKRKKSELTDENLLKVMSSQLVGDDQTGAVASMGRVVNLLKDNNAVIKIEAGAPKGKSKYQIIVNGKVVDSGMTLRVKDPIYTKLDWDENTDQIKQQVSQYALDSKGSDDIISKTATADYPDGGDPLFMLKNAFIVKDAKGNTINGTKTALPDRIARSIAGTLKGYQEIFNVSQPDAINNLRSPEDILSALKKSITLTKKVNDAGGTLHPNQERLLAMEGLKDFPFTESDFLLADIAGRSAVIEKLSDKVPEMSPSAKSIIAKAIEARKKYNNRSLYSLKTDTPEIKAQKKAEKDMYEKALEEGKLTDKDVEALAYWTVTSQDGDITWGTNSKRKFVRRYDTMIGNSPEVSKTYYDAYEQAPRASETDAAASGLSADDLNEISLQGLSF